MYLSGAISKLTYDEAFALFEQAEREALQIALEVVNPMKIPFFFKPVNPDKPTWGEYMVNDLHAIWNQGCDSLYMLNNWRESSGATIEKLCAELCPEPLTILYQPSNGVCYEEAKPSANPPENN